MNNNNVIKKKPKMNITLQYYTLNLESQWSMKKIIL